MNDEERVPLHSHCIVCGRPIKFGETFCSESCRRKYEEMVRAKKRFVYITWGITFVFIAIVLGIYLLS